MKSPHRPFFGNRFTLAVVARPLALFGVLGLLKFFILLATKAQLYEEKWRFAARPPTLADRLGLLLVAGLLLAAGFQAAGILKKDRDRARTRVLAVCLFFFGFLFYLVGRDTLGSHYLLTLARGTITPGDLRAYVFMDFFDRPPYLAASVGAFLVAWAVLWRLRREYLAPVAAALVAGQFLVLNNWRAPIGGGKVVVVATVGVAGWLAAAIMALPRIRTCPRDSLRHAYLWSHLAALTLLAGVFFALWGATDVVRQWQNFLTIHLAASLCLAAILWYLVARLDEARAMSPLLFAVALYLFLGNAHYPLAENYSAILLHAVTLPAYWFGELAFCLGLATAWLVSPAGWRRWSGRIFDLVAALCIAVSAVDLIVLRLTGIRLSWQLLTIADDVGLAWNVAREFFTLGNWLIVGLPLVAYLVLASWLDRHRESLRQVGQALGKGLVATVVLTVALGSAGRFVAGRDKAHGLAAFRLVAGSPLTPRLGPRRLPLDDFLREADYLGFAVPTPAVPRPDDARDWNVVLIILESMHCRHLSLFGGEDDTQPLLSRYAGRMHLFGNFYAPFPNSNHARFSIYNGLYSTREYVSYIHPRLACPSIPEILQANGWTTSLFYSSTRNYTRLADYLEHRGWDFFHDESNMPLDGGHPRTSWGVHEFTVLKNMRRQIARHAANDERFFLSYIPASPHRPFDDALPEFKVFDEGVPTLDGNYVGRYKNLLLQMDWVLHTLINDLESLGLLDKTVVLMTSDHGEFLGEDDGRLGHGWSVEPAVARIPLIVMRPDDPTARVYDRPGSHVDVMPTLMDILRLPMPAGHFYQGVSLYRKPPEPRFIYLSSNDQRAIVHDGYLHLETSGASRRSPMTVMRLEAAGAAMSYHPVDGSPAKSRAAVASRLDRFERFQQSLIRHYESYLREAPDPGGPDGP